MEFLVFFLKGLLVGLAVAIPLGPIGVLCLRRTLDDGPASGLISGLGAATADALFCAVAAFGLTSVSDFLMGYQLWLRIVGGAFIFFLGFKIALSQSSDQVDATGNGWVGNFSSTFFLTIANPQTILGFAAIFSGLGLVSGAGGYGPAGAMVAGVFMGSNLWWAVVSLLGGLMRGKLNEGLLIWVNRVAGGLLVVMGLAVMAGLLG